MHPLRNAFCVLGKLVALGYIFIGGGFLAIPIILVLSLSRHNKRERAQYFVRMSFRFYLRLIQLCGLVSIDVKDRDAFARCEGKLIVANHPSLLDVVILMALIPRSQCIIKNELWRHPFLGILMRSAGYIRNDLPPEELVEACRMSLAEGLCLIIFPEGTRTIPDQSLRFQRGFANIATLTSAGIQTVIISCDPPFLYKNEPLFHFPAQKPHIHVRLGDYLDAQSYSLYGERSINARKLVESLELYYGNLAEYNESGAGAEKLPHRRA